MDWQFGEYGLPNDMDTLVLFLFFTFQLNIRVQASYFLAATPMPGVDLALSTTLALMLCTRFVHLFLHLGGLQKQP